MKALTACAISILLLGGCATTGENEDGPSRARSNDCFNSDRVAGYKVLSRDTLLVWSPSRACAYLVGVGAGCHSLRSTFRAGFADRDGRICGFADDRFVTDDSLGGDCLVTSVEKLTPERMLVVAPDNARTNDEGDVVNCGVSMSD